MKTVIAIVLSAGMALPFAAFAQSSDVDYCNELSATYRSSSMANAAPQAKSRRRCRSARAAPRPRYRCWRRC